MPLCSEVKIVAIIETLRLVYSMNKRKGLKIKLRGARSYPIEHLDTSAVEEGQVTAVATENKVPNHHADIQAAWVPWSTR